MNWSSQTVSCCKDELPVVRLGLELPELLESTKNIYNKLYQCTVCKGDIPIGNVKESVTLVAGTFWEVSLEGKYKFPIIQSQRGKVYWQRKGIPAVL